MLEYEKQEFLKRNNELVLIASENYPSQDVLDASGSIFQLKYAEGFAGKRYYQGCDMVDKMETDCMNTCLELFSAQDNYLANVQPNSGASANMIVYNAVLNPNDTVMAMDVKAGGHISHSHPKSFLAKYHNVVSYGVDENGLLDYKLIEEIATETKPKLIVCGASNYPREIDFYKFKNIANKVGAYLMCDIAHISLLVAHGQHQSPVGIADFITFTTHKCMKGPRGGVILYKKEFDKQIKLSTIPSLFGGPLEHQIYAKLICFKEALTNESKEYSQKIVDYAQAMANVFSKYNIPIVSGKTENHLMTIDLSNFDISGKGLAILLEKCGVICNCNSVPNDTRSFLETSGVRLGTPAIVARGLSIKETEALATGIATLIKVYDKNNDWSSDNFIKAETNLSSTVAKITSNHPLSQIYPKYVEEKILETV